MAGSKSPGGKAGAKSRNLDFQGSLRARGAGGALPLSSPLLEFWFLLVFWLFQCKHEASACPVPEILGVGCDETFQGEKQELEAEIWMSRAV